MQEIRKAGYQAPDISFFVPTLADQINKELLAFVKA